MVMLGVSLKELDPFRERQALIDAAQAGAPHVGRDHVRAISALGWCFAVPMKEVRKPKLWLARTLDQAIVMIEEMTGEELTPEEVEELRQVFGDDDQEPRSVH